jgi:hypothetical protein
MGNLLVWGDRWPVRRADNLTTFLFRLSRNCGSLNLLEPKESIQEKYYDLNNWRFRVRFSLDTKILLPLFYCTTHLLIRILSKISYPNCTVAEASNWASNGDLKYTYCYISIITSPFFKAEFLINQRGTRTLALQNKACPLRFFLPVTRNYHERTELLSGTY